MRRARLPLAAIAALIALGLPSRVAAQGARSLPLVEDSIAPGRGHLLAVVLSGDGNWASTVREIASGLLQQGMPVLGLESAHYLSRPRTPEELAADLAPEIRTRLARWNRDSLVIVGYSRGADLAPFLVNRLPADLRERVVLVALFAPADHAGFQFHLIDLIRDVRRSTDLPTAPELVGLRGMRLLCVHGLGEKDSPCPLAPPGTMHVVSHTGGHRIEDGGWLADLIRQELRGSDGSR